MTSGDSPDRPEAATSSDAYRDHFERSADAILIIEGDRFVECNDATVKMLRYSTRAEVLETHPSELSPPLQPDGRDSFEKANEMIATAVERGSHRFEWDHLRADGEVFPVEVLLTPVHRDGRDLLHVVWRDITERKQLEERLLHAQKMEAIGKLAGGIAHDFNNLLVVIGGNADLIEMSAGGDAELQRHVGQIQEATESAAGLVRELLAFGRRQSVAPRVFDLRELVRKVRAMLGRLIGEAVTLEVSQPDEPLLVYADPRALEQAFLNLAANARDAMPTGGTLRVETLGAPGGERLVRFRDDGVGMDAQTAARAFEPFFTTKELGKGTGLGLASVYGVVRAAGGSVRLESAPGVGTRFEIALPPAPEGRPATSLGVATDLLPVLGGAETILLAEDEDAVRDLVSGLLSERGYDVHATKDGREALTAFLREPARFELVLTDVIMPRMSGPELVAAIRRAGFDTPVLFMSGYTDDALIGVQELGEQVELLPKPFRPRELIGRVRLALDVDDGG